MVCYSDRKITQDEVYLTGKLCSYLIYCKISITIANDAFGLTPFFIFSRRVVQLQAQSTAKTLTWEGNECDTGPLCKPDIHFDRNFQKTLLL